MQSVAAKKRADNLIASHPGNTNAVRHGVFSERTLEARVTALIDELEALPWCDPVDRIAIAEVARLIARIEAIDRDIEERGHFGRNGARVLLDQRIRLSGQLLRWLKSLGALPSERAAWAARLGEPTHEERVQAKLAELEARKG